MHFKYIVVRRSYILLTNKHDICFICVILLESLSIVIAKTVITRVEIDNIQLIVQLTKVLLNY